jgi:hypothetical protein
MSDPRNDQHLIIVQLHVAFCKFHNRMVDHVRERGTLPTSVFTVAQRLARWHYQWAVIHDFLPRIVGQPLLDQMLQERPGNLAKVKLAYYKPKNPHQPMLPVEFAVAAYRFAHSMIRPRYTMNATATGIPFFEATAGRNLNGGRPIPADLVIDWRKFFNWDVTAPTARMARRIDTRLAMPLFALPASVVPDQYPLTLLSVRDLLRGKRLGLPSGQQVARLMGVRVLSNAELQLAGAGWNGEAPLWYYILKEAELLHAGRQLGPVGGRIVAEVMIGLLQRDKTSYLALKADWQPAPPIAPEVGQFRIVDLLQFAGVA